LAAIGTPQAQDAIIQFRAAPSRIVRVLWSGFDTPEPISTSFLGQLPSDSELTAARYSLNRENIFSFGTQKEALDALARCIEAPPTAPLSQLEAFLGKGLEQPRGALGVRGPGVTRAAGVPDLPRQAFTYWIDASRRNFGERDKEIRSALAAANKERLEAHILNQLKANRDSALAFYQLLPNRSDIAKLQGLDHPFRNEDEIPLYLAELRQQDVAQRRRDVEKQVDDARLHTSAWEARLAAFLAACQNDRDFGLALIPEFIEPLLADPRWAVRKKTIETLAQTPSEPVYQLLERYSAAENDYELQSYARQKAQSMAQSLGGERQ
jgi:hypothetical protein